MPEIGKVRSNAAMPDVRCSNIPRTSAGNRTGNHGTVLKPALTPAATTVCVR